MAIIADHKTRVLIQGITGKIGRMFAKRMIQHGTPLIAGVTPGKSGEQVEGVPVYSTVQEAVGASGANLSLVLVPPTFVKEAVFEAIDAGISTIIVYAEGVSVHDSLLMIHYAKLHHVNLFGPNSAGIVSPGIANVSDLNDEILTPGPIGIVSRSGTLTYEVVEILKKKGFGVSTVVCLGGDPIIGVQHAHILRQFEKDPETEAVIYVGEIGGNDEIAAAEVIKQMTKPVIAYISGVYAPPGKRMGHAGAIIRQETENAKSKQEVLSKSGAIIATLLTDLANLVSTHIQTRGNKV